jgi:hypothetical protein
MANVPFRIYCGIGQEKPFVSTTNKVLPSKNLRQQGLKTRMQDQRQNRQASLLVLIYMILSARRGSKLDSNAVKQCYSVNTNQSSVGVLWELQCDPLGREFQSSEDEIPHSHTCTNKTVAQILYFRLEGPNCDTAITGLIAERCHSPLRRRRKPTRYQSCHQSCWNEAMCAKKRTQ